MNWLLRQGAEVTITDLRTEETLDRSLGEIDAGKCRLVLGAHQTEDFRNADLVVANPAVPHPWSNIYLSAAREAGVPCTPQIVLLTEQLAPDRCTGITGSAGKSTTAAMTHHLLVGSGHDAVLGGNIGGSLLNDLDSIGPATWTVLELSSAQLYWISTSGHWKPGIAGITNLTPNHLDWHESLDHYRQCKESIGEEASLIASEDCQPLEDSVTLRLPGEHNRRNAALAVALVRAAAAPVNTQVLETFNGLPHRLCPVGAERVPRYFDDSKSTTPEATTLAVAAFPDASKVHLIAGGYDKGVSLSPIAALGPSLAGLYTIGATGVELAKQAHPHSESCGTLDQAVASARSRMRDGEVLLLSPGCASWDQFEDYRQRGAAFASLLTPTS